MLRIAAGQFKNKLLKLPPQNITRPSSERLRKAIFNILSNHLDWSGLRVLDAFSGSGAMGIEALSRGASHVVFCENQKQVAQILQKNIVDTLKNNTSQATLYPDLFQLETHHNSGKPFDLIFLDPPYDQNLENKALTYLYQHQLIATNCIIVIEQRKGATAIALAGSCIIRQGIYGKCQITLLKYDSTAL